MPPISKNGVEVPEPRLPLLQELRIGRPNTGTTAEASRRSASFEELHS